MTDSTGAAGPSPAAPGAGAPDTQSEPFSPSRALRRLAAAFTYPNFRNLWFGACTSSIGTWMQSVAQNWLVLTLTGSAFFLGLDAFLAQLPIMLFTLVGGVVADRRDRRRVLLASQYIQMTSAFTLAVLVFLRVVHPASGGVGQVVSMTVWYVLGLSFVNGCAQSFGGPAYQSLVPSLVDKKDLPNAIALNSIQFNLARIIGPLLAGLAYATLGTVFCFTMNGLSFVAVIVSLLLLNVPPREPLPPQPMLEQLRGGLSYVRHEGPLLGLTVVAFLTTFLGMPLMTLLPVIVLKVYHLGVAQYTWMMAFQAGGAVVGALIVAWVGRFRRMGSVALIVPNQMRGRVMSIYMVSFRGGMPLGSLTAGALANIYSAPSVLAVDGALLMVVGVVVLATYKKLRNI